MSTYRCPDPGHADSPVLLKANNERVYECPQMHKYWRREEGEKTLLVNLISQERFPAVVIEGEGGGNGETDRPRLNFMVDVPFTKGQLDFNRLSLTPHQWKIIARVDGKANLEEVRLLAGLTPQDAEGVIHELVDLGLIEVRRRGGR